MSSESDERQIVASASANLLPYDLEGPLQPDIGWLPLSYDRRLGQGSYLMRLQPGARTIAHEHLGFEDFIILEGELIDSDRRVLRPGDFVSYRPGTRHNSWTETGCLIAVFEWRPGTPAADLG
jgi:mannose-6-phosphate isomerase-like protein (cupin superfamily)